MTRIEADAVLGAPPQEVWRCLVDHERWPEWCNAPLPPAAEPSGALPGAPEVQATPRAGWLHLEAVTLLEGPADGVGGLRECVATVTPPLWVPWPDAHGGRHLRWTERVADVRAPWLLELDVEGKALSIRRVRLRLILVAGEAGETRVRLRLSYSPGMWWPLDVLCLRRAARAWLRGVVAGLDARYGAALASAGPAAPAAAPYGGGGAVGGAAPPLATA